MRSARTIARKSRRMAARSTEAGFLAFTCGFGAEGFGAGSSPHPTSTPNAISDPSAALATMRGSCPVQLEPDPGAAHAPPVGELLDEVEAPTVRAGGVSLQTARN